MFTVCLLYNKKTVQTTDWTFAWRILEAKLWHLKDEGGKLRAVISATTANNIKVTCSRSREKTQSKNVAAGYLNN